MEQAAYPSLERGIGGIMKRLFILLSVSTLLLAGCSGQKEQPITEEQSMEITSQVEENERTESADAEIGETEAVETENSDSMSESVQAEAEKSKEEPEPTTEPEKPQQDAMQSKPEETTSSQTKKTEPETSATTEAATCVPTESEQTQAEPEKQEPVEEPKAEEPKQAVSYDPNQVVALATAKTKAAGKISIPEDLDNMLANGEITKEEYDAYYSYDGAGYYSVFVETDLNEAATTSGRKLGSVEGIADYISGMLALETGPYFYIEYTGITNTGGRDFYEFRCYRA